MSTCDNFYEGLLYVYRFFIHEQSSRLFFIPISSCKTPAPTHRLPPINVLSPLPSFIFVQPMLTSATLRGWLKCLSLLLRESSGSWKKSKKEKDLLIFVWVFLLDKITRSIRLAGKQQYLTRTTLIAQHLTRWFRGFQTMLSSTMQMAQLQNTAIII